ncbi:MAG TPA: cytochrome c biogenesis protein CcdA [Solirubrobacteraceae bacterium]|jgi:cytochrome c-type biogenesis protein|nr:cytochrome c biogenesis protein CcdA [Solirubrobacteraceae bacterium]
MSILAVATAHLAVSSDTATGAGVFAAIAAGFVSFLSPCVLPLVPGYLSTVAGVTPAEMPGASTRRVLVPSALFVASFSLIFILLGLTATQLGSSLVSHQATYRTIGAWFIIGLGVLFVLSPFVGILSREWRVGGFSSLMKAAGRGGPVVVGMAFAFAWTPCVGPTLGAILTQASVSSSAAHGALLLAFYSAGLGIPFLLVAVAFDRATHALAVVKRHYPVVIVAGGALLVTIGILILEGTLTSLNIFLQRHGLYISV